MSETIACRIEVGPLTLRAKMPPESSALFPRESPTVRSSRRVFYVETGSVRFEWSSVLPSRSFSPGERRRDPSTLR